MGNSFIPQRTPRCIANGVDLVDHENVQMHHGDLYVLGDVYIFNGSGCEWLPFDPTSIYKVVSCSEYFYRNGIFVFHKSQATLNAQLQIYIGAEVA